MKLTAVVSFIGLPLIAFGCTSNQVTDPDKIVFPDTNVSYSRHVQPYLTLSCAFAGCHHADLPAGGVRLTDYSGIMFSRANLVVPGKPDESLIIFVMDKRIPHSDAIFVRINDNHLKGLKQWITEGAINN